MQHSAVSEVPQVDGSWDVLVVFLGLLVLTQPLPRRVVVRLARRVGDWAAAHRQQTEEWDPEEQQLWLLEHRRKLCADLRRVEHLLATDEWMSATRQRGNRIAYNRLVDDLRQRAVNPESHPEGAARPAGEREARVAVPLPHRPHVADLRRGHQPADPGVAVAERR